MRKISISIATTYNALVFNRGISINENTPLYRAISDITGAGYWKSAKYLSCRLILEHGLTSMVFDFSKPASTYDRIEVLSDFLKEIGLK